MKYLLLEPQQTFRNIDDALNLLRGAVREAIHLNRTLVIGTFAMAASDDLNCPREETKYDRFIDLDKTQICKIENGDIIQIEGSFNYVDAEKFNLKTYKDDEILLTENNKLVTKEQNNRYALIIRKPTTGKYADNYPRILVRFYASAEVDYLSNTVLEAMGTSLTQVKKRFAIHYNTNFSSNQDFFQKGTVVHPACYACIQIPYYDGSITCEYLYATDSHQIKNTIRRLRIPGKTKIYFMADIQNHDNLRLLKGYPNLYRYSDFPQLKALVSDKNRQAINNAMLYSVEKNILQYAALKIMPFQALTGLPIVYTNSSHRIPWRYKFLAWYKSLIRTQS